MLYGFLMRKRIAAVEKTAAMMARYPTRTARERHQLERFNAVWKTARENVPFYHAWQVKYGLPDAIGDLGELRDWPVLTKGDLRNLDDFRRKDVAYPRDVCLTGGSTGEPVRLPAWKDLPTGVSQMIGRRAYGIEPGDRTFLLWGHEHLYGTGVRRRIAAAVRQFKDWLAGWTRVSAYDLGAEALHCAYARMVRVRPKFIIGFSPAVLAFVRQNAEHAHEVSSVRVILCTAGPLTSDEKQEIIDFFTPSSTFDLQPSACAPRLCMEYGSVECGVMAYTRPADGEYEVFWNTHLIQAQKQGDGECRNLVTRLTDCYVPLIRYDIGDYIECPDDADSVLHFRSVKGRPSEMIRFACGVSFFGALIGDCVKQVAGVIASQIAVDEAGDYLEIRVVATHDLSREDLALVSNRFSLVVKGAERLRINAVQVEKLFTTVGGKTPRVVRI